MIYNVQVRGLWLGCRQNWLLEALSNCMSMRVNTVSQPCASIESGWLMCRPWGETTL
jgi:hypothetical protein